MPLKKDGLGATDSVGVKIWRGTGEVEELKPELAKALNVATDNPAEVILMQANKMEGKNLAEWQIEIYKLLMESIGQAYLNPEKKKFAYRVRLEIFPDDPICQRCLCYENGKYLCNTDNDAIICESFIPCKGKIISTIWQWIQQGRIIPWQQEITRV